MPQITTVEDFDGFVAKVQRLNLDPLVSEIRSTFNFLLQIEESKYANGTQGIRASFDRAFARLGGWGKVQSGGVDWSKRTQDGTSVAVEVQVSGRSDMLAVDLMHLKDQLEGGGIDVGVIIVPDDVLSYFLTDRTPNLKTALKHIRDRASALPIRVYAFRHDGSGPALPKIRTNLGKQEPKRGSG